jgi:hypothetical protein
VSSGPQLLTFANVKLFSIGMCLGKEGEFICSSRYGDFELTCIKKVPSSTSPPASASLSPLSSPNTATMDVR